LSTHPGIILNFVMKPNSFLDALEAISIPLRTAAFLYTYS